MAALLEHKLTASAGGRVLRSRLEDADLPPTSFDGVVSATAFHWVDPERRYDLAARLLRADGALALIRNDHVLTARNAPYYRGARASYRRHAPEMGPRHIPPRPSSLPGLAEEMEASGRFSVVGERRFGWERRYTTAELIRLLRTYSPHRAMAPSRRQLLFGELRDLVDERLGGSFDDRYVTTACVGRKVG
jgi:hypothetical protein